MVHYSLRFTAYKAASGGVFLRCGTLSDLVVHYSLLYYSKLVVHYFILFKAWIMVSTIIIDEVYYMKYYCWAWVWWKILYSIFFFFFVLYICMLYTQFYNVVYLLEFKKIISFSYKEYLVSRCVYIQIKVDNFVYTYNLL